nr:hypothetical protein CFP56_46637 [Quercus suber]
MRNESKSRIANVDAVAKVAEVFDKNSFGMSKDKRQGYIIALHPPSHRNSHHGSTGWRSSSRSMVETTLSGSIARPKAILSLDRGSYTGLERTAPDRMLMVTLTRSARAADLAQIALYAVGSVQRCCDMAGSGTIASVNGGWSTVQRPCDRSQSVKARLFQSGDAGSSHSYLRVVLAIAGSIEPLSGYLHPEHTALTLDLVNEGYQPKLAIRVLFRNASYRLFSKQELHVIGVGSSPADEILFSYATDTQCLPRLVYEQLRIHIADGCNSLPF